MDDVLTFSAHTRQHADKILSKTQLLEKLSSYGTVKTIGSYSYDLMFDPDIDLVVICDQLKESAVSALKSIIDTAMFSRYEFGDFIQFPQNNRPHGYILVLQLPFDKRLWEIEIWFKSRDGDQLDDLLARLKGISSDQRKVILEIKQERAAKEIDKKKLSSVEIYEGVLTKGHKSLKDFFNH